MVGMARRLRISGWARIFERSMTALARSGIKAARKSVRQTLKPVTPKKRPVAAKPQPAAAKIAKPAKLANSSEIGRAHV